MAKARPDSTGKLGAVGFVLAADGESIGRAAGADLNAGVLWPPGRRRRCPPKFSPLLLRPRATTRRQRGIANYEAALKANNKVYTLYMYEGTEHGFHNDTTPRYDETAAKLAWTRTLEFFNKYLR